MIRWLFTVIVLCTSVALFGNSLPDEEKFRVYGYVIDTSNRGIEMANVYFEGTQIGTSTNPNGYYELSASTTDSIVIVYSMVGYKTMNIHCTLNKLSYKYRLNFSRPVTKFRILK